LEKMDCGSQTATYGETIVRGLGVFLEQGYRLLASEVGSTWRD